MTQNWRSLFHPRLGPLQVLSYLKLNRSRLLISLIRSRSARQLDMMVWGPKSSTLSPIIYPPTLQASELINYNKSLSSLINGKSAKLHHCTKVLSNVKEITIAPYQCCQSYLKSSNSLLKYLQENNLLYKITIGFPFWSFHWNGFYQNHERNSICWFP